MPLVFRADNSTRTVAIELTTMSNFDHNIYKNDPVLWKSYVNKRCSVTTSDRSVHTGVLYTVDPVSESVVLLDQTDSANPRLKIVSGHAVCQIDVISADVEEIPHLFQQTTPQPTESFVADRKKTVMSLLLENRFPVTEIDDVLQIEGIVSINPPYNPDNCVSTNPIVLTRIHSILSQLK